MQYGRGAGITGIIDFPALGALLECRVYGWDRNVTESLIDASGRGDDNWGAVWSGRKGGNLAVFGLARPDGWIMPTSWEGLVGTITVTMHTGVIETLTVRVTGQNVKRNEKTENLWNVGLTCQITAMPTQANASAGGSQPTPDDETHADKKTWEGMQKVVDPNSLQDGATERILIYGVTDSDSDEVTEIAAQIVAATTPITGLKLRPVSFSRLSADVCVVGFQWGRTDTEDDIEMPATVTHDDATDIQDNATICQVTSSSTAASPPTAPVGKHVSTDSVQLHDSRWRHVFGYANNSPKDEIEQGESSKETDDSALTSTDRQTQVTSSSTPPADPATRISGLVLRRRRAVRITETPEQWKHSWDFGVRTEEEDITYPGTVTSDDASDLQDETKITKVGSPPSAPSTPSGLSLVDTITEQLTDAGKYKITWVYRRNTRQAEIEYGDSKRSIDPSLLQDAEFVAQITASATPPADPTPVNTSLVKTNQTVKQLTGGKWEHIFEFGWATNEDRMEFDASLIVQDANDLKDREVIAVINTSSGLSTPSPTLANVKLYDATTKTLRSGKYIHIYDFRNANTKDEIENDNSKRSIDPSALQDAEIVSQLTTSATPPADPTPVNTSLVKTGQSIKKLNDVSWLHTFEFGWVTNEDRIEFDASVALLDASGIKSEESVGVINTSSTPPATPSTILSSMQLVSTRSKALRTGKWLHVFSFSLNTTTNEIENDGTVWQSDEITADTTTEATVVATTLSGDGLRDSLWGIWQDDETFKELSVKRLTPGKLLQKITTKSNDIVLMGGSIHTFEDSVKAIPAGLLSGAATFGSPVAKVLIGKLSATVAGGPGGATSGRIDPIEFERTRGEFVIERRYVVTVANYDTYLYASTIGFTNNAEFLGFPAYWVKYIGAIPSGRIPASGSTIVTYRYHFTIDSAMFFTCPQMPTGWVDADSGLTFGSIGFFDPSTILDDNAYIDLEITWPGATSFSAFIT